MLRTLTKTAVPTCTVAPSGIPQAFSDRVTPSPRLMRPSMRSVRTTFQALGLSFGLSQYAARTQQLSGGHQQSIVSPAPIDDTLSLCTPKSSARAPLTCSQHGARW